MVSEDRGVVPEWPLQMAERHRSAVEWSYIQTQLVYPPPARTTRTALPVGTGKSVERGVDLQLQGLMSWGRGWQPGHVAENRGPQLATQSDAANSAAAPASQEEASMDYYYGKLARMQY